MSLLRTLRQSAFIAANSSAFGAVLSVLDKVSVARQGVLAVVTYHRVDEAKQTPHLYPGLISADPKRFENHLDMLGDVSEIVSMEQVILASRGEIALPPRSVLITFDDACDDFEKYAWPALRTRGMPATVFVPTAFPGQPDRRFWWDRLFQAVWHGTGSDIVAPCGRFELASDQQRTQAFKTIRDYVKRLEHGPAMRFIDKLVEQQNAPSPPRSVLDWDRLRALARQGVTLAAHTQTHPLLTRISPEEAQKEISGSRDDLKREIGDAPPVFAYPGGEWNLDVARIVREEGFELAFTVHRGINDLKTADPFSLNRINIGQKTSTQILRAQLMAGWWRYGFA